MGTDLEQIKKDKIKNESKIKSDLNSIKEKPVILWWNNKKKTTCLSKIIFYFIY